MTKVKKEKELLGAEYYMKLAIETLIDEYNDVKLKPDDKLGVAHVEYYDFVDLNGLGEQCTRVVEREKELKKENAFKFEHTILANAIEFKYCTVITLQDWLVGRIEKMKQYLIDEGYIKGEKSAEKEKKERQAEAKREYMKKYMREYKKRNAGK